MQDSLRIGGYSGSQGAFTLKDGAMHCFMDVFVGAANGVPHRATKAALHIQGGSFLGRTLTVGIGWGALNAVPPGDDVTLVSAHVRTQGTFDDLPEGSEITAE
jgi:hypothetical protein